MKNLTSLKHRRRDSKSYSIS